MRRAAHILIVNFHIDLQRYKLQENNKKKHIFVICIDRSNDQSLVKKHTYFVDVVWGHRLNVAEEI